MHPIKSGQGWLPRYGGGWMHQFGHIYALQQELLNSNASNWFHAIELWHTARTEGIAMNVAHTRNILRQCAQKPCESWQAALKFIKQQERERTRLDAVCVGTLLAMCTEARQFDQVERIFAQYHNVLQLDSICYLALIRARLESGHASRAVEAGQMQSLAHVPFLPNTYTYLLEACVASKDEQYAYELVRQMREDRWQLSTRAQVALQKLHISFDSEPHFFLEEPQEPIKKENTTATIAEAEHNLVESNNNDSNNDEVHQQQHEVER